MPPHAHGFVPVAATDGFMRARPPASLGHIMRAHTANGNDTAAQQVREGLAVFDRYGGEHMPTPSAPMPSGIQPCASMLARTVRSVV